MVSVIKRVHESYNHIPVHKIKILWKHGLFPYLKDEDFLKPIQCDACAIGAMRNAKITSSVFTKILTELLAPLNHVHIDTIRPLQVAGADHLGHLIYEYIVIMKDIASKTIGVIPVEDKEGKTQRGVIVEKITMWETQSGRQLKRLFADGAADLLRNQFTLKHFNDRGVICHTFPPGAKTKNGEIEKVGHLAISDIRKMIRGFDDAPKKFVAPRYPELE